VAPPPWDVTLAFDVNVANPGDPAAWTCLRQDGIRYHAVAAAVFAGFVKVQFMALVPVAPVLAVTYNTVTGTAYDVYGRGLWTGKDFPVT